MESISPSEAAKRLQSENAPRLIDCREEDEFKICHIDGAELVPLSRFSRLFSERFPDKNESIIIYCHHGKRGERACLFLQSKGYTQLSNLAGGIDQWSLKIDTNVPRYTQQ